MSNSSQLLLMGRVGRAHGVKGELAIDWFGDTPLRAGQAIYLGKAGSKASFLAHVLALRSHKGRPLVFLEGISDRGAAELLTGNDIYLPADALPALEDDEAFLHDLIGARVLLPDGSLVGVLDHVEFPAGQHIWAITASDGNEILFPAQPQFIKLLDPAAKHIIIDPPPGLLEIYHAGTS